MISGVSDLPSFSVAEEERRTDRLFVALLWGHFAAALLLGSWYHTWAQAVLIGLPAAGVVTLLARLAPGSLITRCSAAAALLIFSALFIQQTHGLTEAHFHVFCALAFLLAYRDWRVVVAGAATIAVHHVAFTLLQTRGLPVYIYTSDAVGPWTLTLIHAGFVVFESSILVSLAVKMRREWERAEDLGLLSAVLAGEGLSGDDLTIRLNWDPKSPMALTAATIDDLLERLCSRIAAAKRDIGQIATQAVEAAQETQDVHQGAEMVHLSIQEVSIGADRQTEQAAKGAYQIELAATMAQEIAHGAHVQAATIDVMSEEINALRAQTQDIAAASAEQVSAAAGAQEAARQAVDAVRASSEATKAAVDAITEKADILSQRSAGVRDFVATIKEIAEQTDLLALNAAIEAAHAGEHGRGFAVVADEVRKLANRATQAAREIDGLIGQMTSGIHEVLLVTRDTARDGGRSHSQSTFSSALTMAQEVVETGERTALLAGRIAELALQNRDTTEGIAEAGTLLNDQITTLSRQVTDHEAIAGRMAMQAASAQGSVSDMASIAEETSAAAHQVVAVVSGQFQALVRLSGIAEEVAGNAESVSTSLARFRTESGKSDVTDASEVFMLKRAA
jgi:methyl-accepting chemotaxis protein